MHERWRQYGYLVRYVSLIAFRRRWEQIRRHPWITLVLGFTSLVFMVLVFLFFHRVFGYMLRLPDFTRPFVLGFVQRLWAALLSAVAFLILISAALNGLTLYYLDDHTQILWSLPVHRSVFFVHRFFRTAFQSTYMVFLIVLPILAAMNFQFQLPAPAVLVQLGWLLLYFSGLAALGVTAVTFLVRYLPVRRLHQLLLFTMAAVIVGLLMVFRMMRPERFVHPFAAGDLMDLLQVLTLPGARYWPQSWVATLLVKPLSRGAWRALRPNPVLGLAGFTLCAAAALAWSRTRLPAAWTRARESLSRIERRRRSPGLRSASTTRWLLAREWWFFSRDPAQWGQLILLGAVIAVFFFNLKMIPIPHPTVVYFVWFLNISMMGFILAALAVRFVLPSFSADGRAYWVAYVLPLRPERVFATRWWFYQAIFNVLAVLMTLGGLRLLNLTAPGFVALNLYLAVETAAVLTAFALYLGVVFRRYDADNPLEVAVGTPGLVYMIGGFLWIGVSLAAVIPWVWFHLRRSWWGRALPMWPGLLWAAHGLLVIATTGFLYHAGCRRIRRPNLE